MGMGIALELNPDVQRGQEKVSNEYYMYIICAECQKEKQLCSVPNLYPEPICCEGLTCMAMTGTTNECVKLDGKHLYILLRHTFVFAYLLNLGT